MAKYTYGIEHQFRGKWVPMIGMQCEQLGFLKGYIFGRRDSEGTPCNGLRLVRSDGKVIDERHANEDVGIGMIVGFPTSGQYEYAASRAMQMAAMARAREGGPATPARAGKVDMGDLRADLAQARRLMAHVHDMVDQHAMGDTDPDDFEDPLVDAMGAVARFLRGQA